MRFSTVASLITAAGYVNAAPFSFPLPNGFPNPSAAALAQIQKQAGGTLPNTPLPTSLKAADITSLQVIATNELFEVAYFTSLLQNVTNGVKGYTDFEGVSKAYIIESLKQIRAQEELHALGANAILQSAGQKTILPCKYTFPVSDFKSAIALAQTFTDLVLGTLPVVQQTFALDGGQAASGLVPLVGSIIAQEGEQNGAYRLLQRKVPSAAPFLTASAGQFAFNALAQNFIVPESCGNLELIQLPHFETLTTTSKLEPKNSTITFESSATDINPSTQSVAYISGQNLPVVVPITSVQHKKNSCTFKVSFPFDSGFSKGLTIAALVNGKGPFANAAAVAAATVAGPGLLEVD